MPMGVEEENIGSEMLITHLPRNISIVRQCEVLVLEADIMLDTVVVENFTYGHEQPNASIISFILQTVHLDRKENINTDIS